MAAALRTRMGSHSGLRGHLRELPARCVGLRIEEGIRIWIMMPDATLKVSRVYKSVYKRKFECVNRFARPALGNLRCS